MKPLGESQRTSLELATARFQEALAGGPGEAYLAERGIDLAVAADHRLGLAGTEVPGFERFVGRLAIPNISARGVVGIKFRDITGTDDRKYDQPAGQQQRLFNLRALLSDSDTIVLTEGEIDCITVSALGYPAVAVPGKNAWNERRHWRLFEGYRRIVLFRDSDDAGAELVKKVLASDLPVTVVQAPGHAKDVNEAHVAGLDEDIRRIIEGAIK